MLKRVSGLWFFIGKSKLNLYIGGGCPELLLSLWLGMVFTENHPVRICPKQLFPLARKSERANIFATANTRKAPDNPDAGESVGALVFLALFTIFDKNERARKPRSFIFYFIIHF
jgi:hypothetical protein